MNLYNIETAAPGAIASQSDPYQHQFPMGRTYMTNTELAELTRAFRGGSTSINPPMPMPMPMPMHMQQQLNYPAAMPGAGGSSFTISGLNLNLSGGTSTQPFFRLPVPPPPPPIDATSSMLNNGVIESDVAAYGAADINNANALNNRFMNMEHCGDLDNYWPPY